jgi:myo-inositol-1(or 4)-monophosphatase
MRDIDLLEPLTSAAHAVGGLLTAGTVPPTAATNWEEFAENFAGFTGPAEDLLRKRLSDLRPGVGWAGEIGGEVPERGEIWVVDPIDGAVQFLQGLPQWSVSVTLVRDGRPVVTVLHSPPLGETYTAVAGHGAHRDGVAIAPSKKEDLTVSMLATSQPPTISAEPEAVKSAGTSLTAVLPFAGAVRNLGPASWQIADTAAGRLDAFWQFGTDDGNLLGGALVAREAGVPVTEVSGQPWKAGSGSFLAAAPQLHRRLVDIFAARN